MTDRTPGYNRRLEVFFGHDKHGRKRAYYWSRFQMRSFPMPLDAAELAIATGTADLLCHKPFTCDCYSLSSRSVIPGDQMSAEGER